MASCIDAFLVSCDLGTDFRMSFYIILNFMIWSKSLLYLQCVCNSLFPCPQLSMTADTGISKEEDDEEDDTMQNTVVLFSNTDKFVLLQVQLLLLRDIYNYPEAFAVPRITVFTFECNINRFIVNLFFILILTFCLLF